MALTPRSTRVFRDALSERSDILTGEPPGGVADDRRLVIRDYFHEDAEYHPHLGYGRRSAGRVAHGRRRERRVHVPPHLPPSAAGPLTSLVVWGDQEGSTQSFSVFVGIE